MTFTEAALEVLRAVGEPLHYKRITELAIERNLLSHVGKSPEITMISRLATLVKTDRGEGPIVKVKPGVFAARASGGTLPANVEAGADDEATIPPPAGALAIPGSDVFPAEEDDDDPILAGLDDAVPSSGGGGGGGPEGGEGPDGGGRGRRRRRRRGRGGRGEGPQLPGQGGGQPGGQPRHEVHGDRGPRRDFPPREQGGGYARDSRDSRPGGGGGGGGFGGGGPRREPDLDLSRAPGDGDLLGKDLADAAFAVLVQAERVPASFARVADLLVRRGRLSGDPNQLAPTVAAALRADAALATKARVRPRFRIRHGEVSLASWRLPREAARFEEDAERAAERQRSEVRRAFMARVNDLPAAGFAELLASWLNVEGVTSLRAVRRPGSSGQAFHFAGVLRRGAEELKLAIVVQRAGRDIDREGIIEVRGSLPHYGGATAAWLVSTGRVTSGAREELAVEGAAPCAAFDGPGLAAAMERAGIGLRQHQVVLADIDFDLLEALGDVSDRRDRERERPQPGRDRPALPVAALVSGEGGGAGEGETADGAEAAEAELGDVDVESEEAAAAAAEYAEPEASWDDEGEDEVTDSDVETEPEVDDESVEARPVPASNEGNPND